MPCGSTDPFSSIYYTTLLYKLQGPYVRVHTLVRGGRGVCLSAVDCWSNLKLELCTADSQLLCGWFDERGARVEFLRGISASIKMTARAPSNAQRIEVTKILMFPCTTVKRPFETTWSRCSSMASHCGDAIRASVFRSGQPEPWFCLPSMPGAKLHPAHYSNLPSIPLPCRPAKSAPSPLSVQRPQR